MLKRGFCFVLCLWAAIAYVIVPQIAEAAPAKFAFLIGNAAYGGDAQLPNPVVDVHRISLRLEASGYHTTVKPNLDLPSFQRAIVDFASIVKNAPAKSVVIFYYAGHGFSLDGVNYLEPVNVGAGNHPERQSVPLSQIYQIIARRSDIAVVMMIDACRYNIDFLGADNGFAERAVDVARPENVTVIFSTRFGTTASDGMPSLGSPFARAILLSLDSGKPLSIAQFASGLMEDVKHLTATQVPVPILGLPGTTMLTEIRDGADTSVCDVRCVANKIAARGDIAAALTMLETGAEEGDYKAQENMGRIRQFGQAGTTIDCQEAEKWYSRAVAQGDAYAHYNLAVMQRDGCLNYPPNLDGAIAHFDAAMKSADPKIAPLASYDLARILTSPALGRLDIARGISLYAANLGAYDCCSAINLAKIYYEGVLVPRDLNRAEELYRYAAQKGNAKGWDGLGRVTEDKGDIAGARRYLEIGVKAGYSNAMLDLSALIWNQNSSGDSSQRLQAIVLMFRAREACEQENATSPTSCNTSVIDANIQTMTNAEGFTRARQFCAGSVNLNKIQLEDCRYITSNSIRQQ